MAKKKALKLSKSSSKSGSSFMGKVIKIGFIIALIGAAYMGYQFYNEAMKSNINSAERKTRYIYIKHNATYKEVLQELKDKNILLDIVSFDHIAELKGYKTKVTPGKYFIKKDMSNKELVNVLKAGLQEKVTVELNNLRTKEQLASRIGRAIEADSTEILDLLNDDDYCMNTFQTTTEQILTKVIPQDYAFDTWAIDAKTFMKKIKEVHQDFWTKERIQKAEKHNLTKTEATILATIVQQEQQVQKSERPRIAGVYLNRLRKPMKLQADPTVIFAKGDFTINRVMYDMLNDNSPYNTYQHEGLPPGPICVASTNAIDAVLNAENHNYIYFCAKEDFSGFHNFTASYTEHEKNAQRYAKALDKRGIK
jgi:UPF0755 protein